MINSQKTFNPHEYVDIFLKRIWFFLIPLVLVVSGTVVYLVKAPKVYRSSASILVSPQKVSTEYVKTSVTSSVETRLYSIAQEIMSRSSLEQVISQYKLYPEKVKSAPLALVAESMRKDIKIEGPKKETEKNFFTISYTGKDPKVVASVTNKLASLFLEENVKIRSQQTEATTEFLQAELIAEKEKVEKAQESINQFKRGHINELPENRDANLRILDQLQAQSEKINDSIKAVEDRKMIIENQLANRLVFLPSGGFLREEVPATAVGLSPDVVRLSELKATLADLRTRYTEDHPDIAVTRKKIADLEKKAAASRVSPEKAGTAKKVRTSDSNNDHYDFIQSERKAQLALLNKELSQLKKEEERTRAMIAGYQGRIEKTPIRELTLSAMIRDFNSTNENYQLLLKKNAEAQQAKNLERLKKGEQFRILDSARVPEKPIKPNVTKTLIIGLVLGLGSGLAAAFFREQMDRSFRDAEDVETTLGVKVLTNIPRIGKEAA